MKPFVRVVPAHYMPGDAVAHKVAAWAEQVKTNMSYLAECRDMNEQGSDDTPTHKWTQRDPGAQSAYPHKDPASNQPVRVSRAGGWDERFEGIEKSFSCMTFKTQVGPTQPTYNLSSMMPSLPLRLVVSTEARRHCRRRTARTTKIQTLHLT